MEIERSFMDNKFKLNDIGVWMKAAEGRAIRSNVKNFIGYKSILQVENIDLLRELIELYNHANDTLIYPLGSIESDLKYTVIALYMLLESELRTDDIIVNVNNGINIKLSDTDILNLRYGNYRIIECTDDFAAEELRLDKYADYAEYDKFKWALKTMLNGQSLDGYFIKYEPDLYKAYNCDVDSILDSIEDVLDCHDKVPSINSHLNCLIDPNNNSTYQLLFFPSSQFSLDEDERIIESDEDDIEPDKKHNSITCFNYSLTVYQNRSHGEAKKESEIKGLIEGLLNVIGGKYNRNSYECRWYGYIGEDYGVFNASGDIYICSLAEYETPILLARNTRLVGIDNENVYMEKSIALNSGIVQLITSKLNISEDSISIVGISYR